MNPRDVFFFALMILTVAGLCVRMAIYTRLKLRHGEAWQKLGKPAVLNNTISNSVKSSCYVLLSSDHRSLNDETLSCYVIAERTLTLAILVLLGVGFALQFAGHLQP